MSLNANDIQRIVNIRGNIHSQISRAQALGILEINPNNYNSLSYDNKAQRIDKSNRKLLTSIQIAGDHIFTGCDKATIRGIIDDAKKYLEDEIELLRCRDKIYEVIGMSGDPSFEQLLDALNIKQEFQDLDYTKNIASELDSLRETIIAKRTYLWNILVPGSTEANQALEKFDVIMLKFNEKSALKLQNAQGTYNSFKSVVELANNLIEDMTLETAFNLLYPGQNYTQIILSDFGLLSSLNDRVKFIESTIDSVLEDFKPNEYIRNEKRDFIQRIEKAKEVIKNHGKLIVQIRNAINAVSQAAAQAQADNQAAQHAAAQAQLDKQAAQQAAAQAQADKQAAQQAAAQAQADKQAAQQAAARAQVDKQASKQAQASAEKEKDTHKKTADILKPKLSKLGVEYKKIIEQLNAQMAIVNKATAFSGVMAFVGVLDAGSCAAAVLFVPGLGFAFLGAPLAIGCVIAASSLVMTLYGISKSHDLAEKVNYHKQTMDGLATPGI